LFRWVLNKLWSVQRGVAKSVELLWLNLFGLEPSAPEPAAAVCLQKVWERTILSLVDSTTGQQFVMLREDGGSLVPLSSVSKGEKEQIEEAVSRSSTGREIEPEQAIAGSELVQISSMPRYLVKIYVDKKYRGLGFRYQNYLISVSHLSVSCEAGSIVTLKSRRGEYSFEWAYPSYASLNVSPSALPRLFDGLETYFYQAPWADVGILPLKQKTWSLLDCTSVGVAKVGGGTLAVELTGTTASDSETAFYKATGVTTGVRCGEVVGYRASTRKGFSGTAVVLGSALDDRPLVYALHRGGDGKGIQGENRGVEFAIIADWLRKRENMRKVEAPEDSSEYFKKFVRDHFNELKTSVGSNTYSYDQETGHFWFAVRGARGTKIHAITPDEFEILLDAGQSSDFEARYDEWLAMEQDEADRGVGEGYRDPAYEKRMAEREEREEMKRNDSMLNDGMRGESADLEEEGADSSDDESEKALAPQSAASSQPAAPKVSAPGGAPVSKELAKMENRLAALEALVHSKERKLEEEVRKNADLNSLLIEEISNKERWMQLQESKAAAAAEAASRKVLAKAEEQRLTAEHLARTQLAARDLKIRELVEAKKNAVTQLESLVRDRDAELAELKRLAEAAKARENAVDPALQEQLEKDRIAKEERKRRDELRRAAENAAIGARKREISAQVWASVAAQEKEEAEARNVEKESAEVMEAETILEQAARNAAEAKQEQVEEKEEEEKKATALPPQPKQILKRDVTENPGRVVDPEAALWKQGEGKVKPREDKRDFLKILETDSKEEKKLKELYNEELAQQRRNAAWKAKTPEEQARIKSERKMHRLKQQISEALKKLIDRFTAGEIDEAQYAKEKADLAQKLEKIVPEGADFRKGGAKPPSQQTSSKSSRKRE